MSLLAFILLLFVALGLARDRLGRSTYVVMGLIIIVYLAYTYSNPQ